MSTNWWTPKSYLRFKCHQCSLNVQLWPLALVWWSAFFYSWSQSDLLTWKQSEWATKWIVWNNWIKNGSFLCSTMWSHCLNEKMNSITEVKQTLPYHIINNLRQKIFKKKSWLQSQIFLTPIQEYLSSSESNSPLKCIRNFYSAGIQNYNICNNLKWIKFDSVDQI